MWFILSRENARRDGLYGAILDSRAAPSSYGLGKEELMVWKENERIENERLGLKGMTEEEIVDLGDKHPSHRFYL